MATHGLIGFVEGKNLFSKLIKWFGKTTISHCMIGFLDNFVVEAVSSGVKVSRLDKYEKKKRKVYFYRIKNQDSYQDIMNNICILLNKYLDVKYGWLQIIGYFFVAVHKAIFGTIIKNPFEYSDTQIVCAELVLYYLRDVLNMKEFESVNIHDPKFMGKIFDIVKTSELFEKVSE